MWHTFAVLALFLALGSIGQGATYSNSVSAGYNLIANQLDGTNNLLDTIFPYAQDNDQIMTWNHATQDFDGPDIFVAGFGWFDSLFNPSSTTLSPGQGAFYLAAQAYSFPVTGTQRVPSLPIPQLRNSYHLVSRQIPGPGTYGNIVGLPPENGSKFIRFNRGTQDYETNTFNGITWSGGTPAAAVGESVFIFLPPVTPPVITQQPVNQAVFPGGTAAFNVAASGAGPITYQWRRNGTALPGQTGAGLALSNVQAQALGGYSCVLANAAGSVTSVVASLAFLQIRTVNLPAGFSLIANPLYNETPGFPEPMDGMSLQKWNVTNQTFARLYLYDTGFGGWVDQNFIPSSAPTLALGEGALVFMPAPGSLNFTGQVVTPSLPVTLQPGWNLLGAQAPIPGGYAEIVGPPQDGSAIYRWNHVNPLTNFSSQGPLFSYFRGGGWIDSPPPVLGVAEAGFFSYTAPVVITTPPVGVTNLPPGQTATFTAGVSGSPPFYFQWQLNGQNIPGATSATYSIPVVGAGHCGTYTVSVGNGVGDVVSDPVSLTMDVPGFNLTDSFAAQEAVTDLSRLLSGHNRNATTEAGEPPHAGKRTGASVWLTWQAPPTNGIMTMSVSGTSFDAVLAVYTGATVSNLVPVVADDDNGGYGCGLVLFNVRANAEYRVCISGLGDGAGDILLGWNFEATEDTLPEFGRGSGGLGAGPRKSLGAALPQDVTTGFGDTAQFSVEVTNGPVSYQWFHEGLAMLDETNATLTISNVGLGDLGQYFARAANAARSLDSAVATLQIQTPRPEAPASAARSADKLFDLEVTGDGGAGFSGRLPKFGTVNRGYSGNIYKTTARHAKDPGEPNHCGITGGASTWYLVQADTNGVMYANSDGSGFDTVLAAYAGPPPASLTSYSQISCVASNNNGGLDGLDSRMSFPVTAGSVYYIALDGVGGAAGAARIAFQLVRSLVLTNLLYTNLSGGRFTMKVAGTPGLAATVQYATNAASPAWITLTNYTSASGTFDFTNNQAGPGTNRIYRAVNSF